MPAATTNELRLTIPMWGSGLLALLGVAYLVWGGRWRRLFGVLSMTILGCLVGLVACIWVPLAQPLVVVIGGLVLGGLTAFFRKVSHVVLAAVVLATIFSILAALAVGPGGFASYLVVNLSDRSYSIRVSGPDLASDPVLAAGLVGLLFGVTLAIVRFHFSEHLILCAQGAALTVLGATGLLATCIGEDPASLATAFPLSLGAAWLSLLVIGMVIQRALGRWSAEDEEVAEESEQDA